MNKKQRCVLRRYGCVKQLVLFCGVFFLCLGFKVHAQVAMSADSLRAVDVAFSEHSSEKLGQVLSANRSARDYGELEAYTLKKIRQFVVLNELDFAKAASMIMIDNNMDNEDALAVYSSTTRAIERRAQMLAEQKAQEERLAAILEADHAKLEDISVPDKSYTPVMNVTSGETFYYSTEAESSLSPINWEVSLGFADLILQTGRKDPALKYGLSMEGEFFYSTDVVTVGGEVVVDMSLLSFFGPKELSASVKAVPSFSVAALSQNLFFRIGFFNESNFMSPIIGISYKKFGGKQLGFDFYADYYIGHLAQEDMKVAFAAGGNVFIPLVQGDIVNMGLNLGLSDSVYMYTDGMDNNLKCIFSLRVGN